MLHRLGSSMASLPPLSLYCGAAEQSKVQACACVCVQKRGRRHEVVKGSFL